MGYWNILGEINFSFSLILRNIFFESIKEQYKSIGKIGPLMLSTYGITVVINNSIDYPLPKLVSDIASLCQSMYSDVRCMFQSVSDPSRENVFVKHVESVTGYEINSKGLVHFHSLLKVSHRERVQMSSEKVISYIRVWGTSDFKPHLYFTRLSTEGDVSRWQDYCEKDKGSSIREALQEWEESRKEKELRSQ